MQGIGQGGIISALFLAFFCIFLYFGVFHTQFKGVFTVGVIKFKVFQNERRDFIIVRIGGTYNQHAHLSDYKACQQLIRMIGKGKLPDNKWLKGSCKRLLTQDEYDKLEKRKQAYCNNPYGDRKKKRRRS